jgi:FixJ family two-component response regulator
MDLSSSPECATKGEKVRWARPALADAPAEGARDDEPTVVIVDDDPGTRRSLLRLLAGEGYRGAAFEAAGEFLASQYSDGPGCLVLDVRLPGIGGMELYDLLRAAGCELPVLFLTGYGDVPTSVRAMKSGALDFLLKPVEDAEFLVAVERALLHDAGTRARRATHVALAERLATLTPREREVFGLVARGMSNKVIAARIGTVEKTVKVHRGRVMEKMRAPSLADLVRMASQLGVETSAD